MEAKSAEEERDDLADALQHLLSTIRSISVEEVRRFKEWWPRGHLSHDERVAEGMSPATAKDLCGALAEGHRLIYEMLAANRD